ncbi:MAG: addiction module toxin RelE [Desulfuromonadaceae bacterium]|nr:addiction module toxin RelE [Desulfuromonadaceae bacterium]
MTRPLRIEFAGAVYHITSRGNAREDIFDDDSDRGMFLKTLGQAVERYNWLCHAYCLMDNHYHLLIETPETNLSAGMRHLNGVYTQAFNRAHNRDGHVFKGRFKAILVEKQCHLLELSRYVVLNPVRANMVAQPEHYPWSSYLATLGQAERPVFLTTEWLLGNFSDSLTDARQQYRQFVTEGMGQIESPWDKLSGQIFLGTDAFVQRAKAHFAENAAMPEIPRQQRHAGRPPLEVLFPPDGKTPKTERNRLIRRAHTEYGYMLKEIAQALGIHYTTVSKVINDERR